jgi:hypothetical protein
MKLFGNWEEVKSALKSAQARRREIVSTILDDHIRTETALREIQIAVESIPFAGRIPLRDVKEAVRRATKKLWDEGLLPCKLKKNWIVGWRVYRAFFYQSYTPILVGPAKPSKLRERYYNDVRVEIGYL